MLHSVFTTKLPEPAQQVSIHKSHVFINKSTPIFYDISSQPTNLPYNQVTQLCICPFKQANYVALATKQSIMLYDYKQKFQRWFKQIIQQVTLMTFKDECIYICMGKSITGYNQNGQQTYYIQSNQQIMCMIPPIYSTSSSVNIPSSIQLYNCTHMSGDSEQLLCGCKDGTVAFIQFKRILWKHTKDKSCRGVLMLDDCLIILRDQVIQMRNMKGGSIHKLKVKAKCVSLHYSDLREENKNNILCFVQDKIKAYSIVKKVQQKQSIIRIQEEQKVEQILNLRNQLKELQAQMTNTKNNKTTQKNVYQIMFYFEFKNHKLFLKTQSNGFIKGIIIGNRKPQMLKDPQKIIYAQINQKGQKQNILLFISTSKVANVYEKIYKQLKIPKFCQWQMITQCQKLPQTKVILKINQRVARYIKWACQVFIVNIKQSTLRKLQDMNNMTLNFKKQKQYLQINMESMEGHVQIICNQLEVVGFIIQDLADYTKQFTAKTICYLPLHIPNLKIALQNAKQASSMQISGEVGQAINAIKQYVLRAEDFRILGQIPLMKKAWKQILIQNSAIEIELKKKAGKVQEQKKSLKFISQMIGLASNLRLGQQKKELMGELRKALKEDRIGDFLRIIEKGS